MVWYVCRGRGETVTTGLPSVEYWRSAAISQNILFYRLLIENIWLHLTFRVHSWDCIQVNDQQNFIYLSLLSKMIFPSLNRSQTHRNSWFSVICSLNSDNSDTKCSEKINLILSLWETNKKKKLCLKTSSRKSLIFCYFFLHWYWYKTKCLIFSANINLIKFPNTISEDMVRLKLINYSDIKYDINFKFT